MNFAFDVREAATFKGFQFNSEHQQSHKTAKKSS